MLGIKADDGIEGVDGEARQVPGANGPVELLSVRLSPVFHPHVHSRGDQGHTDVVRVGGAVPRLIPDAHPEMVGLAVLKPRHRDISVGVFQGPVLFGPVGRVGPVFDAVGTRFRSFPAHPNRPTSDQFDDRALYEDGGLGVRLPADRQGCFSTFDLEETGVGSNVPGCDRQLAIPHEGRAGTP